MRAPAGSLCHCPSDALRWSQAPSSSQISCSTIHELRALSHSQPQAGPCSLSQWKCVFPPDLTQPIPRAAAPKGRTFCTPPCPHSARVASRERGATEVTPTSETAAKRKVSNKRRPAHILSPFGLKDPRLPAERALPAARPMQSG